MPLGVAAPTYLREMQLSQKSTVDNPANLRCEGIMDICGGAHRYFVATDGTIEGPLTIKIYAVVVCTVCKASDLIEHIMVKDAEKLTAAQ